MLRGGADFAGGFTHSGWGPQYGDEILGQEMAKPGDMLLGRRTWQDFTSIGGSPS